MLFVDKMSFLTGRKYDWWPTLKSHRIFFLKKIPNPSPNPIEFLADWEDWVPYMIHHSCISRGFVQLIDFPRIRGNKVGITYFHKGKVHENNVVSSNCY